VPVLALGVSYRRAPVELLERLAIGRDDESKAYRRLAGLPSVRESVVLSTCNRVEVYAEVSQYHHGFQDLKRFLTEATEVDAEEFADPLYSHYEDDAAEHLFSVAAGLDSMVLGEPQILAQVRAAFRRAEREAAAGPELARLFQRAVRAGRRVRAETAVGASPAAFVEAAALLAERHLGALTGRAALVVGAGEMAALAARTLRQRGVAELVVLGRRPARAEAVARRVGGRAGGLDGLAAALGSADVVVSSTGATGTVIPSGPVRAAGRPLFIVDLAVPRDVDPEAARVPGVRLADIDDLREVLAETSPALGQEVRSARGIVEDEAGRYALARRTARLGPLIEALHARSEEVRSSELRRVGPKLAALSERDRAAVEALTRRIVRRLLHEPVVRLKDLAGRGAADVQARTLAELFDLDLPED
jgi:glutamyl-tRNA reductase